MQAMIFVRRSGAFGLGHVGWGFQYSDGSYDECAVENQSGMAVDPPGQNGFWNCQVVDPLADMRRLNYDGYKTIPVNPAFPNAADDTVAWLSHQWYLALGSNCVDFVYDALRSYGADLPWPLLHLFPNDWFNAIQGNEIPLSKLTPGVAMFELPVSKLVGTPKVPAWRQPGTQEWIELKNALSTGTLYGKPPTQRSPEYERLLERAVPN
jgi:hypothetical protein